LYWWSWAPACVKIRRLYKKRWSWDVCVRKN
jgi:hypothetical protein